ncbi:DNA polymerase IV [Halobacteriovorax marinus]|uniref:DNA polymerase IV n=1 Tax=Halobacteriovorax marinus TaxID=97084 RepID=UPI000BC2F71F|nr:DNA polymerase IV [Halobacteriovorax marinus]ATH07852.1 DNA polymerase IV [Halobacteriovorax marinus]
MERKIIHIDMDCFYAAVEMRDDPSLRNIPIAIGGPPNSRSVLCTSNYKAREFGVKAAMPSSMAIRKCPHLKIIPPNFSKYKEASSIIHTIFKKFTDRIEPLSLDEAFLDVTDCELFGGSATLIAKEIQKQILEQTKLTASAGVAPNKFLAKIASDWKKPAGLFVITPDEVDEFVKPLDVRLIPGIGKVSAQKLYDYGLNTCEKVRTWKRERLESIFGKMGASLYLKCRGIDQREVISTHDRKSISVEHTFNKDIEDINKCLTYISELRSELLERIRRYQVKYGHDKKVAKAFVKLKFLDFQTVTVEKKKEEDFYLELWKDHQFTKDFTLHLDELAKIAYQRGQRPVRLIGIGIRLEHGPIGPKQLKLI